MAEGDQGTPVTPGGSSSTGALAAGQRVGAGRYTLQHQLGQGGMGTVWLARDEQLGDEVALKFLAREISHDSETLDELRRETLKSRKLTHTHIIRIHDLHQVPGEAPFISMEYVAGESLSKFKAQQPQRCFTWDYLKPLVKQLCDALDYAHDEQVIHRDLKPANLMLDAKGRLKLADFGLAAVVSESMSRTSLQHTTSGTPAYMSPQQMDGRPPRVTDDIYALGATLYELLTSKPPFYHGDILHQVRNLPPDALEQRLAEFHITNSIPPDVAALIMACLAKNPEQRPQSAGAVAEWVGITQGTERKELLLSQAKQPRVDAVLAGTPPVEMEDEDAPAEAAARSKTGLWIGGVLAVLVVVAFGAWWLAPKKGDANREDAQKMSEATPRGGGNESIVPASNRLGSSSVMIAGGAATQPSSQSAEEMTLDLSDTVSLKLTLIPAGTFLMGSPQDEDARRSDETQHAVTISKPFYMGVHHVTVNQFAAFVKDSGYKTDAEREGWSWGLEVKNGKYSADIKRRMFVSKKIESASWRDPGFDQKGDHPVVQVSWNDAKAFCDWLTKRSGKTVMLPTEAQWEYACRAGTKTAWPWGDNPDDGKGWANCADQSLEKKLPRDGGGIACFNWDDGFVFTSPAGSFKANAFGLFDMIGNAAHWCQDQYGDYEKGPAKDPTGVLTGMSRVVRGGSWNNYVPKNCRSACRYHFAPDFRNERYGFRVVVDPALGIRRDSAPPATAIEPTPVTQSSGQRWTNTLGMVFAAVPGTPSMFSIWETRVQDYDAFAKATDRSWQKSGFSPTHPASLVSWDEAKAFCQWLTEKERSEGRLGASQSYRLPTDAEWSLAVGLPKESGATPKDKHMKIKGIYPWGNQWPPPKGAGNYGTSFAVDNFDNTSPVGSFVANRYGLYDLGGNVREWCEDEHYPGTGARVLRGASWGSNVQDSLLSSDRYGVPPDSRLGTFGFRCVLVELSSP